MITQGAIAARVRRELELTHATAAAATELVFRAISEALADDEAVRIVGFGTYKSMLSPPRRGHNPQTGKPIEIAEQRRVRFAPSKVLKDTLNPKRSRYAA